jgi:hypothetical protein
MLRGEVPLITSALPWDGDSRLISRSSTRVLAKADDDAGVRVAIPDFQLLPLTPAGRPNPYSPRNPTLPPGKWRVAPTSLLPPGLFLKTSCARYLKG